MIRTVVLSFLLLLSCLALPAQTRRIPARRVYIYPEHGQILMLDTNGQTRVIAEIPQTNRTMIPASAKELYAHAGELSLIQNGKDWHMACTNGDAVFYLHSPDSGAHWTSEVVDHILHYDLQTYDRVTGEHLGPAHLPTHIGQSTQLVLDAEGNPHLAYIVSGGNYETDCYAIYAHRQDGQWKTEKVLTPEGYPKRYLGGGLALEVDAAGVPNLAVASHEKPMTTRHSLCLFTKTEHTWTRQLITSRSVAYAVNLKIDSQGHYHVLAATPNNELYYWCSSNGGSYWEEELVMTGNCRFDMVLDSLDQPHIAGSVYNDGVYYGVKKKGTWELKELEDRKQMCFAKVILNPEGKVLVGFYTGYNEPADLIFYNKINHNVWDRDVILHTEGGRGSPLRPAVGFVRRAEVR